MKTYFINVAPHPGCGIGFVSIGENENHALAELSLSLRQRLKIKRAHMEADPSSQSFTFWERDVERHLEILRTIRKPGRVVVRHDHPWVKVTVKEVTKAITTAYVKEVWLDRNL